MDPESLLTITLRVQEVDTEYLLTITLSTSGSGSRVLTDHYTQDTREWGIFTDHYTQCLREWIQSAYWPLHSVPQGVDPEYLLTITLRAAGSGSRVLTDRYRASHITVLWQRYTRVSVLPGIYITVKTTCCRIYQESNIARSVNNGWTCCIGLMRSVITVVVETGQTAVRSCWINRLVLIWSVISVNPISECWLWLIQED